MGVKKSIRFDEVLFLDAKFVADYQDRDYSSYVRYCVRIETQKRLKAIKKSISDELHLDDLINLTPHSGSPSEDNFTLSQLIRKIIKKELSGETS